MKTIDNISSLFGDDLKSILGPGTKLKIAASCFSIYAYEALKEELSKIEELAFVFTFGIIIFSDLGRVGKRKDTG